MNSSRMDDHSAVAQRGMPGGKPISQPFGWFGAQSEGNRDSIRLASPRVSCAALEVILVVFMQVIYVLVGT